MDNPPEKHIFLLRSRLSLCGKGELLRAISRAIVSSSTLTILSGNVHAYNLAYENLWLGRYFNQVDYVRLDGEGVRLGAYLLGHVPPERMTWADFGWDLAHLAASHGFTLYFLGAQPGIADQAASRLIERIPNLKVVGTHHGYFDRAPGSMENEAVIQEINRIGPQIVIVGFGMPLQERWLMENRDRLAANVVMTGGAVFDYLSGELRRGPGWLTRHGFEWLARLIIEPKRLWRRYLLGNPLFFWRVAKQRFGILDEPS